VCFSVIGPQQHRIIGAIIIAAVGAVYVLPIAAGFALAACLLAWWTGGMV